MTSDYLELSVTLKCGCPFSLRLSTELGSDVPLKERAESLLAIAEHKMAKHVCPAPAEAKS